MNAIKKNLPYGTWPSPVTPELISQGVRLSDVQFVPGSDDLVWLQAISGKPQIFYKPENQAPYALSADLNPSGGVGYGGGEFVAGKQGVFFSDKGGRLYFVPFRSSRPKAISPAFGATASPSLSADGAKLAYVHTDEGTDVLAVVDANGKAWPQILASGADFYMQPAWSQDGRSIAWVEWDHPNMPWDGTRLQLAFFEGDKLGEVRTIDGGPNVAVFQPLFSPDGKSLIYLTNHGEWDQLVLIDLQTGHKNILVDNKAILPPAWVQGIRVLAWASDGSLVYYIETIKGLNRLHAISLSDLVDHVLDCGPYTMIDQLTISDSGTLAFIGQSSRLSPRIVFGNPGNWRVAARTTAENLPAEALPVPEQVSWVSREGVRVFGLYYPPNNPDYASNGPAPLVVHIHGGPTSQEQDGFSLDTAFYTSRGYGLLKVNYRGSTGYGRAYREALRGRWGELDVQDAVEGAKALVATGKADPQRLIIKGGSAGGYTVLNALINHPGFFKAGISQYGVANLFLLDQDTHKFESHYTTSLVGALPAAAQKYHAWSPVFHAEKIKDPMLIFQGSDDKVVPVNQSEDMVNLLRANGVPVTYRLYEGEGHGFRKAESLLDYYKTIETFLKQYVIFAA